MRNYETKRNNSNYFFRIFFSFAKRSKLGDTVSDLFRKISYIVKLKKDTKLSTLCATFKNVK